jgi:hypothetical protein
MAKHKSPLKREVEILPTLDRGLSREQVAEMTGLTVHHLANLGVLDQGPPFRKHKAGKRGRVIYLQSEVIQWLRSLPIHGGGQQETRREA